MRVLLIVRPAAGGIRQHVLSILEWADKQRVTFAVAAPADFLPSLPPVLPAFPIKIAPRLSPVRDIRAARRLQSLAGQYDILHAHGLRAGWVCALARVPFILTAHNLVERSLPTTLALRLIGARASRIVAVSQAVADTLIAGGIPSDKVAVIPNGVNAAWFTPPQSSTVAQQNVACIARLSPEKGVDVLLAAARLCPNLTFAIAGEGPQLQNLQHNAPSNVTFAGRVPDTRPLLWASNVLVIPSRSEGQGIVALEAMAAHLPIIASQVGGLPDMVLDGQTGLLVPPGNPAALAAALRRLFSDALLRERLADNALQRVHERYDIRRTVAAIVDLYVSLSSSP